MAHHFWARIEIGGELCQTDVPRFCRASGIDQSRLNAQTEDGHFLLEDDEAPYGQFEELETLCRELSLPYVRQSDGKYEVSPEICFWQPGMDGPRTVLTDHENNMQVDMDDVRAIRDALVAGDIPNACFLADRAVVDLPDLPPFRMIH